MSRGLSLPSLVLALGLAGCAEEDPCALARPVMSIDDSVALANDLPEPTLACFVTALERPLGVELSSSPFSLQPAEGARSPRVLISSGPLVLSVVPVGEARHLLELGELLQDGRSLKAELAFPVPGALSRADAFTRTHDTGARGVTSCGVCHAGEIEHAPGEFASQPLRPAPKYVAPLELLREEHARCDHSADVERCELLEALFGHGPVEQVPLPETYAF